MNVIDEWIDSECAARYAAEYYGIWNTKEEEKQTMADQKQEHIFVIKNTCGNNFVNSDTICSLWELKEEVKK